MSESGIRIRPLHCGSIRVSPLMPYGGARDLKRSARILVDTGLCRR